MADNGPPLIVDARGMRCPWPVLRAARAMRGTDHILLVSDDPVARRDVPDMAAARGWSCIMTEQDGATGFILRQTECDIAT